jgi:hypothetical protein
MVTSESDNSFIKFLHHFNLISSRWLISLTLPNCDGIMHVEHNENWYQGCLTTLTWMAGERVHKDSGHFCRRHQGASQDNIIPSQGACT